MQCHWQNLQGLGTTGTVLVILKNIPCLERQKVTDTITITIAIACLHFNFWYHLCSQPVATIRGIAMAVALHAFHV